MKFLFLGDVMGRAGRRAVTENLATIRNELKPDFVIVNAENATNGRGVSVAHARDLLEAGADCLTLGDHAFDQREMIGGIEQEQRIVRPLNYGANVPGRGSALLRSTGGKRVLVAQVLGRVFMRPTFGNPFTSIDAVLAAMPLRAGADAIIVDIHAEATSEKNALGLHLDGRVSLAVGSHTHVPTADYRILPRGTAYQTDAGMCGVYDSVIGMDPEVPLQDFRTGLRRGRMAPARGPASLCGIIVETSDQTGLATSVAPFRAGHDLTRSPTNEV